MITDNRGKDDKSNSKGLENRMQHNRGFKSDGIPKVNSNEDIGKPVDNGGFATSDIDNHLEKQWLAVRDNYLANFPELNDMDTTYDNKSFRALIDRLAKRRKQTSDQVREELLNWPSSQ